MVKVRAITNVLSATNENYLIKINDEFYVNNVVIHENGNFVSLVNESDINIIPIEIYIAAFERIVEFLPEQLTETKTEQNG